MIFGALILNQVSKGVTLLVQVLDNQKNTCSQFSVLGLREIHRNLKQNKNSIFARAFLENPLFVIFLHKSWIWQTLGQVMNIFYYCYFHNASKECFWSKKISNFMHGFKSAILAKLKNCQNGTFEPVHEI